MSPLGYRAGSPFHHSTNTTHAPRSKTPNPTHERRYPTEQLKRSRTPLPYEEEYIPRRRAASTSTWVTEQHHAEARYPEQHHTHTRAPVAQPAIETLIVEQEWNCESLDAAEQQQLWEKQAHEVDFQARMWMIQEEARRIAAMREAERTRLVQEEVRRIQAKIHKRREVEKQRIMEERRRAREEEEKEWERCRRAAVDRAMTNAWSTYEKRWAAISSSSDPLSFTSIPWPLLYRPSSPSSITTGALSAFLLSQTHSTNQTPKERIKEALRRWHPDRFGRHLKRVPAEERRTVEEAVGIVARCLNELLSGQTRQTQSKHP